MSTFFEQLVNSFTPLPPPPPPKESFYEKVIKNSYYLIHILVNRELPYWTIISSLLVICVVLWTFIHFWEWFAKQIKFLISWGPLMLQIWGFAHIPYVSVILRYILEKIEQTER